MNLPYTEVKFSPKVKSQTGSVNFGSHVNVHLVWHFLFLSVFKKNWSTQKCFRILVINNYENDYATLLQKSNTTTIEIKRLRTLAIQIFKTINNTIPSFMKGIFTAKRDPKIGPYNILPKHHKSEKYMTKV